MSSASSLIPAYVMERLRLDMRINPQFMKCVVFIGIEDERGAFAPIGTGFLITPQVEDVFILHVATAAHVVEDLSEAAQARLVVRANRKDGTSMTLRLQMDQALTHEKRANDVMLIPLTIDPTILDYTTVPGNREVIAKQRAESGEDIAPGDSVAVVGLYTSHHGAIRNAPVLRTGNIAALADEPVLTARGYAEAHLIELRTIAGLSGSPVFQTAPPVRIRGGKTEFRNNDLSEGILLGLLTGYHCIEDDTDVISVPRFGPQQASSSDTEQSTDERNTGFGVVILAERIFEIFEREDVQKRFAEQLNRHRATALYKKA